MVGQRSDEDLDRNSDLIAPFLKLLRVVFRHELVSPSLDYEDVGRGQFSFLSGRSDGG